MLIMTFKFDSQYRQSQEYKDYIEAIKKDAPWMPLALAEACIIAHLNDPQAYKKDKQYKKVLSSTPQPPQNKGEIVVDSVHISDLTQDIIKQRQEFDEKYLNQNQTTIEEVQA
jgi:hypothetical protein